MDAASRGRWVSHVASIIFGVTDGANLWLVADSDVARSRDADAESDDARASKLFALLDDVASARDDVAADDDDVSADVAVAVDRGGGTVDAGLEVTLFVIAPMPKISYGWYMELKGGGGGNPMSGWWWLKCGGGGGGAPPAAPSSNDMEALPLSGGRGGMKPSGSAPADVTGCADDAALGAGPGLSRSDALLETLGAMLLLSASSSSL